MIVVRYVGKDIGASLASIYLMQRALVLAEKRRKGGPLAHHARHEEERAEILREAAERLAVKQRNG